MSTIEIETGRKPRAVAMVRAVQGYDGRIHAGAVLGAILPAATILMVAAAILVAWQ